jgi:hypothetical protein
MAPPLFRSRLLIAALLGLPAAASAAPPPSQECADAEVDAAARQLPRPVETGDALIASACRNWPWRPTWRLSAVAFETGSYDEAWGGRRVGLVLAIHEGDSRIATHMVEEQEDASIRWGENALWLDTARYDLVAGIRAFGMIQHTGYSPKCADGSRTSTLTLFVPEGGTLRPVFSMDMSRTLTLRGGCYSEVDIVQQHAAISIALAETTTHGFRDLWISADISGPEPRRFRAKVVYDGKRYATAAWERAFDEVFYAPWRQAQR